MPRGLNKMSDWLRGLWTLPDTDVSPARYRLMRRNLIVIMLLVSLTPLFIMALINNHESQKAIKGEVLEPMQVLADKTRQSFELFLAERLSAVSFIASAYTYDQLADQEKLEDIFRVMRDEFGGFVDLGLIDGQGMQVSYVGPYELTGKNYRDQHWFQEVQVRGAYISDVFMGYRKFPHFVIAVRHQGRPASDWVLRATIDTDTFNRLIADMSLDPESDAFILNAKGQLETDSKYYGKVLDFFPIALPQSASGPATLETTDPGDRSILLTFARFRDAPFALVLVKPRSVVLKSWYALTSDMFFLLLFSTAAILVVVFTMTNRLVRRIEYSDLKRQEINHHMEHSNKLASIGRLAAGVAHEINNPLAIINEKAGLMRDLVEHSEDFSQKTRFVELTQAIAASVARCSTITHRLLGFARRMDVRIEPVDVNAVMSEVLGFLDKEAMHRNIDVQLKLADDLPRIESDQGQLQQVFLNLLNNAFEAIDSDGWVRIATASTDDGVAISVEDNGCGMSKQMLGQVFEPFFTSGKTQGTGLGLSITYGIVKKLGGSVMVHSTEGVGTEFVIKLPLNHKQQGEE